jgi:hypothetical protein
VLSGGLVMLAVILFFQQQVRARREEGVWRLSCRDHRDGVMVLGAEAAQHVEHLARLTHWLTNITETIGELLEAPGVLSNVHVALDKTPELGLKVDRAMKFVVAELSVDAVSDAVGGGVWRSNYGAHVLGDRVV